MQEQTAPTTTSPFPQHPLWKSFLLSVIPGLLVTAGFILFRQLLVASGYPPLLAFLLAILFIDLPVLLGVMLVEGKRLNGRYSLEGVVLYREKVSWPRFLLVFIGAFALVYLLIMLLTPLNGLVTDNLFPWLPEWFFLEEQAQYAGYAKNVLVISFVFQLLLTGIALPWVEELYFRGYLLPRISRFGWWAPLVGGFFFALYHVWSLFSLLTIFLLGAVLGYVAWWTRDIRLPISLHVFANAFIRLLFLMAALSM